MWSTVCCAACKGYEASAGACRLSRAETRVVDSSGGADVGRDEDVISLFDDAGFGTAGVYDLMGLGVKWARRKRRWAARRALLR